MVSGSLVRPRTTQPDADAVELAPRASSIAPHNLTKGHRSSSGSGPSSIGPRCTNTWVRVVAARGGFTGPHCSNPRGVRREDGDRRDSAYLKVESISFPRSRRRSERERSRSRWRAGRRNHRSGGVGEPGAPGAPLPRARRRVQAAGCRRRRARAAAPGQGGRTRPSAGRRKPPPGCWRPVVALEREAATHCLGAELDVLRACLGRAEGAGADHAGEIAAWELKVGRALRIPRIVIPWPAEWRTPSAPTLVWDDDRVISRA
jgi:hypothetical protein